MTCVGKEMVLEVYIVWPLSALQMTLNLESKDTAVLVVSHCSGNNFEQEFTKDLVSALIDIGTVVFSFLGPQGLIQHDTLDEIIESISELNVVTTWHAENSGDDAAHMLAGWNGLSRILFAVDQSTDFGSNTMNSMLTVFRDYVLRDLPT